MFQKVLFRSFAVLVTVALLVAPASATTITHGSTTINMDFVTVGNTDNVADSTTYGAVNYSYDIGKYEVTEDQWDAVVAADTNDFLDDAGYWIGKQPVADISWHEAAMFCNWLTSGNVTDGAYVIHNGEAIGVDRDSALNAHGRVYVLPTEDEWYKAAYYDAGTSSYNQYPTGPNLMPDGIDFDGDTEFDAVFHDGFNQHHPNDVDNAGVLGPYGTMAQCGNVWEWIETQIGYSSSRGKRGGSYVSIPYYFSNSYRTSSYPASEGDNTGFRVAVIPEPDSIILLICGLVAGWRQRRLVV